MRRMSIELEGRRVEEDYDVSAVGLAVAQVKSFTVSVNDGALNIVFRPKAGVSKISAIEVISLER